MNPDGETVTVDRLIDVHELARLLDVSPDTVYRMTRDPELGFPQPIDLGRRRMFWRAKEYNEWITQRAARRDAPKPKRKRRA
jgi:excisionase family DNA binding protein